MDQQYASPAPSAPPYSDTRNMGAPAAPTSGPTDQGGASWDASDHQQSHPYVQCNPVEKAPNRRRETARQALNYLSNKAETTASNIWQNLKTGQSVPQAAWGKLNLTAKTITGGGFESFYKQNFTILPGEELKKTFASYLSTLTGPVNGTLFLSNARVAFCSDQPLSFTSPSGDQTWRYYKVTIPLGKIAAINPVILQNATDKYIQIVTIDGHDFWFMGFVNYDKAVHHLSESLSKFVATGMPVPV